MNRNPKSWKCMLWSCEID